jgi:hypothetical protein
MQGQRGMGGDGISVWAAEAEADALDQLRWDWGEAYEIGRDGERGWHARRRDGLGGYLVGTGPDQLRYAIRADYTIRPVPRDHHPGYLGSPGEQDVPPAETAPTPPSGSGPRAGLPAG